MRVSKNLQIIEILETFKVAEIIVKALKIKYTIAISLNDAFL